MAKTYHWTGLEPNPNAKGEGERRKLQRHRNRLTDKQEERLAARGIYEDEDEE